MASKRPCRGCGKASQEKYCAACQAAGKGKDQRPSAAKRRYDARWRKFALGWLARPENHFCVGWPKGHHGERLVPATLPDHIKSLKQCPELQYDEGNLQPLCVGCNTRKAVALEGGGWRHV